jgi:hypothetical protein
VSVPTASPHQHRQSPASTQVPKVYTKPLSQCLPWHHDTAQCHMHMPPISDHHIGLWPILRVERPGKSPPTAMCR